MHSRNYYFATSTPANANVASTRITFFYLLLSFVRGCRYDALKIIWAISLSETRGSSAHLLVASLNNSGTQLIVY